MKTTIELPEEVLQRAKITAIQRKTTLKELICLSLIRELDEPTQAKSDPSELAAAFSRGRSSDASIGRFDREQAQRNPSPPSQTLAEDELPYVIDPRTGMAVSRSLNTPGFVPPTAEESQAMIERAEEEEGLDTPSIDTLPEGELPYEIDPQTGFPMARTLHIPGFVPPTVEESRAIIERANEEEDLRRAGLLR